MTVADAYREALRLYHQGRHDPALAILAQILAAAPDYAMARHLAATLLYQNGHPVEAEAQFRELLRRDPLFADAYLNFSCLLQDSGRREEAVTLLQCAIILKPEAPGPHNNLGNTLAALGRFNAALVPFEHAIRLDPRAATPHCNAGNALVRLCRYDEAIRLYQRALLLAPQHTEAYNNLGYVYKEMGQIGAAVAAFQATLALQPDQAEAYSNLGSALKDQGLHAQAATAFRQAVILKPHFACAETNLAFLLTNLPEVSATAICAAHRAWGERHGRPLLPVPLRHDNLPEPDKRLRVGFVSPDFRTHSVAYFFEPLVRALDRSQVAVHAYAEVPTPSPTTYRLKALCDGWCWTVGLDDAALAAQIRRDGIDILVDLAGHTGGSRILAFARKPAPVQATWLGYPATTGLAAIDYRVTDALADPPGTEDEAVETLIRLPGGFLCYQGSPEAPPVSPPPCTQGRPFTFGSFNNLSKLTEATLAAWTAILRARPDAQLFLKCKQLTDPQTQTLYRQRFARQGIDPARIRMHAWTPEPEDHLHLYAQVDLALDTFPYNGTTTTCEALWMGVPVVTLTGDRHAARVGKTLLTRIGRPELVTGTPEAYVATALALAADPARLAALRRDLRPQMLASPLGDANRFAREMEAAFRTIWRNWCRMALQKP